MSGMVALSSKSMMPSALAVQTLTDVGLVCSNDWLVHSATKVRPTQACSWQQHYSVFGCVSSNGSVSWIRCCRMQVTRAEYALLILSFFAILQSEALCQTSSWRPV